MPFISIQTSRKLTLAQKEKLKAGLGEIISILPGKSESGLMVEIEDARTMFFAGEERESCAFVDLRLYRPSPLEAKQRFVEACFELLREAAGLEPDDIYLNIMEFENWASHGKLK